MALSPLTLALRVLFLVLGCCANGGHLGTAWGHSGPRVSPPVLALMLAESARSAVPLWCTIVSLLLRAQGTAVALRIECESE